MSLKKQIIANNKKAFFDYNIESKIEAGIVLSGTEVKSLRKGRISIAESYASEEQGELYLINSFISEYDNSSIKFNHDPKRHRKLLVKKRERNKLFGAINKDGMTLVPLNMYFNHKGIAKLELGLAKGKKEIDKRATIKEREWNREKSRILKNG